jgi:single-strand DNA-binding protein
MNKIILIGIAGKDPDIKDISGKKNAKISLATSEYFKKNGEKHQETTWHNISFWGDISNIVENFVKKGSKIMVEGKQIHKEFEKDGKKQYYSEVIAEKIELLSNNNEKKSNNEIQLNNDDLPF